MYNRGIIMNEDERILIYNWVHSIYNNMRVITNGRRDYIILPEDNTIPSIIFDIRDRIIKREQLEGYEKETKLNDFIGFIPIGGFIHKHKDMNDMERNLYHVRFNVYISIPKKGCTTYYDDNIVSTIEGCYVLSRSGIDLHWTDVNQDIIPRISLSFGFLLPADKVNDLCKIIRIGKYRTNYPL